MLRVFDPAIGADPQETQKLDLRPEQTLIEKKLDYPILQLETGLFSSWVNRNFVLMSLVFLRLCGLCRAIFYFLIGFFTRFDANES